ncbi:MAG: hypothetical protein ACI4ML_09285 [Aristaeellaceae bacterium]
MLRKLTWSQWLCLALAVALAVLAVVVYQTNVLITGSDERLIDMHKQGVGALGEGDSARQSFTASRDGLAGVDVMVSNYNQKVSQGTLTLWLTDEAGQELARQEYPVSTLKNSVFVTLEVPLQDKSKGRIYVLHASSDCTEKKGVTLRMGPVEEPVGELALPDGTVTTENAVNLRMRYEERIYGGMGAGELLLMALSLVACVPLAGRKERIHG